MSRDNARKAIRFRLTEEGDLWVVDPDPAVIESLGGLDPALMVATAPAPVPSSGFQALRRTPVPIEPDAVAIAPTHELWLLHDAALGLPEDSVPTMVAGVSILDIKVELARRALAACNLCGHRCGVNRLGGERGNCGLLQDAYVGERFVHCAEEPPINPSFVVNLQGCSWRCLYCQQYDLLSIRPQSGHRLDGAFWMDLDTGSARSLSFVGGNPDESTFAILNCLSEAPADFNLPVVWNSNLYGTPELYRILEGAVDVYVPDFRYGNDGCAERWSGAPNYWEVVTEGLRTMSRQSAAIFVRILVLPGHVDCCHLPALTWMAENVALRVKVRLMDQYGPMWRIGPQHGEMARRPTPDEIDELRDMVKDLGLVTI